MLNLKISTIRLQMLILAIALSSAAVSSQSSEEIKEIFTQAESYFIFLQF